MDAKRLIDYGYDGNDLWYTMYREGEMSRLVHNHTDLSGVIYVISDFMTMVLKLLEIEFFNLGLQKITACQLVNIMNSILKIDIIFHPILSTMGLLNTKWAIIILSIAVAIPLGIPDTTKTGL